MRKILVAGLCLAFSAPAFAQDAAVDPGADTVTIGVGAASVPRYEGSDDSTIVPVVQARATLGGIAFSVVGTGLYVDLIPRRRATGGKLLLGPVVHATLNRTSRKMIRDPQIIALGKLDTAIEVGAQVGYTQTGVFTSDYDTLTISVAAMRDVASAHGSYIVSPSVTYGTPLSQTVYVGASAAATYVGDKYARTYFNVSPGQSLASGLPVYTTDRGFKDVSLSALAALSLSGDLRRGFAIFVAGSYTKLLGDFKRSPVVRDSSQLYGGVGIGYTF